MDGAKEEGPLVEGVHANAYIESQIFSYRKTQNIGKLQYTGFRSDCFWYKCIRCEYAKQTKDEEELDQKLFTW